MELTKPNEVKYGDRTITFKWLIEQVPSDGGSVNNDPWDVEAHLSIFHSSDRKAMWASLNVVETQKTSFGKIERFAPFSAIKIGETESVPRFSRKRLEAYAEARKAELGRILADETRKDIVAVFRPQGEPVAA